MTSPEEGGTNTETESYILSPRINQRVARVGGAVLLTAIGAGVALLGGSIAAESRDVLEKAWGVVVAGGGTALAVSIPIIYFHGDPDLSPHRMPPAESPTPLQQEL